jgi:hypothetical protein
MPKLMRDQWDLLLADVRARSAQDLTKRPWGPWVNLRQLADAVADKISDAIATAPSNGGGEKKQRATDAARTR